MIYYQINKWKKFTGFIASNEPFRLTYASPSQQFGYGRTKIDAAKNLKKPRPIVIVQRPHKRSKGLTIFERLMSL